MVAGAPYYALAKEREGAPSFFPRNPSLFLVILPEIIWSKVTFEGDTVWEGVVEVFDLIDHPTAKRCYAWSHAIDGSTKRKFIAVLHQGPVDSPRNAVKAAIVGGYKDKLYADGNL